MPPPNDMRGKMVRPKHQQHKPPLFEEFLMCIDFTNPSGRLVTRSKIFEAYQRMFKSRFLSLSPNVLSLSKSKRRFFMHFAHHLRELQRNGVQIDCSSEGFGVDLRQGSYCPTRYQLGFRLDGGPIQRLFDPFDFFEVDKQGRFARPFERLKAARLVGYGAFATRFIQCGEIVTEYMGCIQSEDEIEAFDKMYPDMGPPAHYEIIVGSKKCWNAYLHDGKVINILENPGAWLNSVDDRGKNAENIKTANKSYANFANCRTCMVKLGERTRLYIRATCDVLQGEELIQNYNNPVISDA